MTPETFNELGRGKLPGLLGVILDEVRVGTVKAHLPVREDLLAPNGYLHAATIVGLADTCAGVGCLAAMPEGAGGFTTIELKTNFLGTTVEGTLHCVASLLHGGRTTQVWDAQITDPDDKVLAAFRCTQLILYPRQPVASAS